MRQAMSRVTLAAPFAELAGHIGHFPTKMAEWPTKLIPICLDMNPIDFYCVLAYPTMLGQNVRPKLNPYF